MQAGHDRGRGAWGLWIKSRRAAKAQDCSAVRRVPPNRACDKALQPVGRAFERHAARRFQSVATF